MNRIVLFLLLFLFPVKNMFSQENPGKDQKDPYLTEVYWDLNRSPMQEKLRSMKPFPVGVVYYQQRGHNLDSIENTFNRIHNLGFTALKQVLLPSPDNPQNFRNQVFHKALDIGIIPWYYGKGGWINITEDVMREAGLDLSLTRKNLPAIQSHPKMIEWQTDQLHQRVEKMDEKPPKPKGMGEPGRNSPFIPERLLPEFSAWLEKQYIDIESLKKAWNDGFTGDLDYDDFMDAAGDMKITGYDEFGIGTGKKSKDFRRYRDAMRFLSKLITDDYKRSMELFTEWDPEEPERTGGHQLFENQPMNGWDLEAQAKAATVGGSFYSSIHLTHHFFLVDNEYVKPVYMQARTVADMFKGGWAATWESTGGPTQWSGMGNYTVDEGVIRQLMMSYVAAGLKGVGFWSWNSRGEGWETGEYALSSIQGGVTKRAKEAGRISQILQEQRFELWEAMDEPVVGILYSWENEAMLGRLSMGTYPLSTPVYETDRDRQFRQYHPEAKIGISRALINQNIPFEYVTERDLEAGLAGRYRIIYLPYVLALADETTEILAKYVKNGGIIITDFPVLMLDNFGRLNKHYKNSVFEEVFGFQTRDYYHTYNSPKEYNGLLLNSQFGDLEITHAEVQERFEDGYPAVVQSSYGKGKTVMYNFELSRSMFRPGNHIMEEEIGDRIRQLADIPFNVEGDENSMVYRRSAPDADHYFIVNRGEEEVVTVEGLFKTYESARELLDNKILKLNSNTFSVEVPARSAVWVRCEK